MTRTPPPPGIHIAYGDGEQHFGHLRLPEGPGPHPVVFLIHGGFWRSIRNLYYAGHMAEALTRRGVATWNIEYRGIGHDGGAYPGTLEDVTRAAAKLVEFAPEYDLDLTRVVAIGHSAGGQLALWLRTIPLAGIVSLAGVVDLRRSWELQLGDGVVGEFMGGSPIEFSDRYRDASPIERLPRGVPVRLIHGEQDDIVPIEISERYLEAATAAGDDCRLLRVESDHFDIVDPCAALWPSVSGVILELARLR